MKLHRTNDKYVHLNYHEILLFRKIYDVIRSLKISEDIKKTAYMLALNQYCDMKKATEFLNIFEKIHYADDHDNLVKMLKDFFKSHDGNVDKDSDTQSPITECESVNGTCESFYEFINIGQTNDQHSQIR